MPKIPLGLIEDGRRTRWGDYIHRFQNGFTKLNGENACWIWNGATDGSGYGQVKNLGKILKAHRVSYELYIGPIPEGLCVLHNCPEGDNPACVNPNHLWLGTKLDNTQDMIAKGRDNFKCGQGATTPLVGEENPASKLTEEQVIEVLQAQVGRWCKGEKLRDMAIRLGVHVQTLDRIRMGLLWKHLYYLRNK